MNKRSINHKQEIIKLGRFLFEYGYIVATDGNISTRLNTKEILITRSGICKGELKLRDIVKLKIEDWKSEIESFNIKPSSEYRMHLAVYKNRQDVSAIIHAHAPYSTVFAVTGKKLDVKLLTETDQTLGKIGYVRYFKPGSLELAKAVGKASVKHNVMILAHHGVVVIGKDLIEARYRLERLEFLVKVTLLSSLLA
jgi:L-fuculose-phosphate aldolase